MESQNILSQLSPTGDVAMLHQELMNTKLSFYKSVYDKDSKATIALKDFLQMLTTGSHTEQINKVREAKVQGKSKAHIKALKEKLPLVTISGAFFPHTDAGLISHSGLLCVDFDGFDSRFEAEQRREELALDKYVLCTFLTASNNLAAIIKIDPLRHRDSYTCADNYFFVTYGLVSDKLCVNESRYRYLSIDPDYKLKPEAVTFEIIEDVLSSSLLKEPDRIEYEVESTQSDFTRLLAEIERVGIDITGGYYEWIRIAYALARTFPQKGLEYFKRISRFSDAYSDQACIKQYNSIERSITTGDTGKKTTISTIFWLAGQYGIALSKREKKVNTQLYQPNDALPTTSTNKSLTQFEYIREVIKSSFDVRLNSLTQRVEIDDRQIDEFFFNEIWDFVTKKLDGSIPNKEKLKAAINVSTWPKYHPIKTYFEKLPEWDSIDRIEQMIGFMDTEKPEYAQSYLAKWLTGVIHCLYGTPNPLIIILIGPQNTGKTEFFKQLFPKPLKAFFVESHLEEKDRINTMNQNLIVFDDEMQGMKKMGPEEIKALTSQSSFALTRKYEAYETKLDRMASICAASNSFDILNDQQNRRILPIHIKGDMNWKELNLIDRDQLMAQAFFNYNNGFPWQISRGDMDSLSEYGKDFERHTGEYELIQKYCIIPALPYETVDPVTGKQIAGIGIVFLSATEVIEKLIVRTNVRTLNKTNIGRALARAGYTQVSRRDGNRGPFKAWVLKFDNQYPEYESRIATYPGRHF